MVAFLNESICPYMRRIFKLFLRNKNCSGMVTRLMVDRHGFLYSFLLFFGFNIPISSTRNDNDALNNVLTLFKILRCR